MLRSPTPAYSAIHGRVLPLKSALVYASDNLSALFFAERSAADVPSAFDKTDWSKYINVDRISSAPGPEKQSFYVHVYSFFMVFR